jgi:hypothetical protein
VRSARQNIRQTFHGDRQNHLSEEISKHFKEFHEAFLYELVLVELTGIEPVASWLQTRRSPS